MARKVLIADKFPKAWEEKLRDLGLEVRADPSLDGPSLTAAVPAP